MNIKTSPGLWKFPQLLSLAHRAGEAVELAAGSRSGMVALVWDLRADDNADAYLVATVMLRGECMPVTACLREPADIDALRAACVSRFNGVEEKPTHWSAK